MTLALMLTAISIGIIHTLLGPDHYVPFIVLSKTRGWSVRKTAAITAACGAGHILSSVALGLVGAWLGISILKLEAFDGVRGSIATWAFIAFGLVYFAWGIGRAFSKKAKEGISQKASLTAWTLFIIFVLGPCEPLIPVLMYPALSGGGVSAMFAVAAVFGIATIATMLTAVLSACYGLNFINIKSMQKWSHAAAGFAVLACGLSMQFLGL